MRSAPKTTTHRPALSFERLKESLATHAAIRRDRLHRDFPHVSKKLATLDFRLKDLRRRSAQTLTSAVLAGGLLVMTPMIQNASLPIHHEQPLSKEQEEQIIKETLTKLLPQTIGPLSPTVESTMSAVIKETLGIKAVAELDGHHLNTTFGRMGGEQHLPRFLGDTIAKHDALQIKGITPARGAFGYFAANENQLTDQDIEREKYYIAVQTLYLPDWNRNYKELKPWYQWRKVLVINPTNGKSVVAVIGDAGPAAWTGKHFGGSPEIMDYLQLYKDKNNGKAVVFFVDDQNNTIALGPVKGTNQFIAKR